MSPQMRRRVRRRSQAVAAVPPVLAVGCLGLSLAEIAAGDWPPATPIAVLWAVATAAPVAFLRARPATAWVVWVAITAGLVGPLGKPQSGALFFETCALLIGVGAYVVDRRRIALSLLAILVSITVIVLDDPEQHTFGQRLTEFLVTTAMWLACVGIGRLIGWRTRRVGAARADADLALVESRAAVDRAVSDERARIARDLHDVVAHSVSLMVVQAVGGRGMLTRQPERALAAIDAIDAAGAQALTELDRMVDVLADHDRPADQPGLARVHRLVDAASSLGSQVSLDVDGPIDRLPAGVDVAAYRIVQEALTNAVKHARGQVRVVVEVGAAAVRLEVRNDLGVPLAELPGAGYGVLGMRERAALYGGTVDAGPVDRQWLVQAVLPVEQPVAVP